MKRILLTTTSLVLAAGVAQADVSFSGHWRLHSRRHTLNAAQLRSICSLSHTMT